MAKKATDYEKALQLVSAADKARDEQERAKLELESARALIAEKEAEDRLRANAAEKVSAFIATANENGLTSQDLDALDNFARAMRKREVLDDLYSMACNSDYWADVPSDMASMLDDAANVAPAMGINSPCQVLSRAASSVRGLK